MKKNHRYIITIISILVVFLFLAIWASNNSKSSLILSDNLYFGSLDISGLDKTQAEIKIKNQYQTTEEKGLTFKYGDTSLLLPATAASFDADLSYSYFYYDADVIKDVLDKHTRPGAIRRWFKRLSGNQATIITPIFSLDESRIKKAIENSFPEAFYPATDAAFVFNQDNIEILQERPGKTIDWDRLFTDISQELESFQNNPIIAKTKTEYPEIYSQDLAGLESEADKLSQKPLTLTFKEQSWPVSRETIAAWLYVRKQGAVLSLDFSADRITRYLEEKIAPEINTPPQDPRFEIKDNKVSSWQLGKDGYELETVASALEIINQYTGAWDKEEKTISLIVKPLAPANAESFDIQEIIGTGRSNFAGSPNNRRHNIATGAASLHGLIIKPGEEFSLMAALGEIDAESGYLPELVIKDNKTIPEYGGGLCQIGTTIFRTALASGLPITARRNHSYRVSYYEPAGTDATIYDPWPDFRFVNDSPTNILIQSRIEGNEVFFDFWGTEDGRIATTTYPVIYNITPPPPTKIIETDELEPGEKKCTERAHNGADAYFDYTVSYPENATSSPLEKVERFSSHYVPWQEVCLVGKTASSTPATESASSSIPVVDSEQTAPIN